MNDNQKAQAHCSYLQRYLYDSGKKCQALVNQIHQETEAFIPDTDFSLIDFRQKQTDYKEKADKFSRVKETYFFEE
jgi:hypothetical protein